MNQNYPLNLHFWDHFRTLSQLNTNLEMSIHTYHWGYHINILSLIPQSPLYLFLFTSMSLSISLSLSESCCNGQILSHKLTLAETGKNEWQMSSSTGGEDEVAN